MLIRQTRDWGGRVQGSGQLPCSYGKMRDPPPTIFPPARNVRYLYPGLLKMHPTLDSPMTLCHWSSPLRWSTGPCCAAPSSSIITVPLSFLFSGNYCLFCFYRLTCHTVFELQACGVFSAVIAIFRLDFFAEASYRQGVIP